ncbi:MAG: hypothetical protein R3A13_09460 [Bdellovibrionota bacterium]
MFESQIDKGDVGVPASPDKTQEQTQKALGLLRSLKPEDKRALFTLLRIDESILANEPANQVKKDALLDAIAGGRVLGINNQQLTSIHLPLLFIFQRANPESRLQPLTPKDLSSFSALEEVGLWGGTSHDFSPLLELHALERLFISRVCTDEQRWALDILENKGVKIIVGK